MTTDLYHEDTPWTGKDGQPHKRFQCNECAFDSLLEHVIQEHVEKYHSEPEPSSSVLTLTDKDGRPKH